MRFGFHPHDRAHPGHGRHGMRGGGRFGAGGVAFGWDMDGEGRGEGGGRRRLFDGPLKVFRRGGAGRRMFEAGELRLVLLRLIGDQPRHGYDLIRAIEERTGGAYAPSPGVVYPTLTLLAEMGQIAEQASEGNRKLFAASEEGNRLLAEKAAAIDALMARLDALGAMRERTDGGPVRRAMANLHTVLRTAARSEHADVVHDVAAILDEAARRIERL